MWAGFSDRALWQRPRAWVSLVECFEASRVLWLLSPNLAWQSRQSFGFEQFKTRPWRIRVLRMGVACTLAPSKEQRPTSRSNEKQLCLAAMLYLLLVKIATGSAGYSLNMILGPRYSNISSLLRSRAMPEASLESFVKRTDVDTMSL